MAKSQTMPTDSANQAPRSRPALLLVDDDPAIAEALGFLLRKEYQVHLASNRAEVTRLLSQHPANLKLALIDLGLPPTPHRPDQGFAIIGDLLQFDASIRILILSGQSQEDNIRHAFSLGAADFFPKPCEPQLLKAGLKRQLMLAELETHSPTSGMAHGLIGTSEAMQGLRGQIAQFAPSEFPVLISGESGTGKELVARALHQAAERREQPYLALNCAAFSPDLLEAQLFGHARGAFTGAQQGKKGFFEEAKSGTLFLDEIGEMPLSLQAKLLRVLEDGEYYRIGETSPRHSQARIIAASNRNLKQAVERDRFRADLYHRLCVLTIEVPPLRQRSDDRNELLVHFINKFADSIHSFRLSAEAQALWRSYPFPGNVRELRNIVIRLGTKHPDGLVGATALRQEIDPQGTPSIESAAIDHQDAPTSLLQREGFELDRYLNQLEQHYIQAALEMAGGSLSKAARLLHINRTTLYSKVKKLEKAEQAHVPETVRPHS
ncbi:sigma-54-dependent transcriptional regulator [Candidatus Endoriftia persephone]|jgi:two-component system nitrogen regulation response regulator GlnG|nr:sigma-54 dependent transcriptional regulator [Candidatus Endoriftia persephone]EGV50090.1 two Component Transcriptional Regulator, Fis family [endosymbiont of Riftia pachyptila (vent Ph05)]USF86256.1 sigma-54 dependent transcriptional regulator [Candidatus Endoriftia persephone]